MGDLKKGSWRTTVFGVGTILFALWTCVIGPITDSDPATVMTLTKLGPEIMIGIGLLFARDNKVKSESVDAK